MEFFETLFGQAPKDALVEFSVGGFTAAHRKFFTVEQVLADSTMFQDEAQIFFGPATRKRTGVTTKANFAGSHVAWVDFDEGTEPQTVLPPTIVVSSGNGWHLYWLLDKFNTRRDQLEAVNQALAKSIGADAAFDATRLLRVPGTYNTKGGAKKSCKISKTQFFSYTAKELYLSGSLSSEVTNLILTGNTAGYGSRSERDWEIVTEMLRIGMEEKTIRQIFQYNSCGDKYRETLEDGDRYMARTIARASESAKATVSNTGILEESNSYFVKTKNGKARISTFVFEPQMLLEAEEGEDTIMCKVRAEGSTYVWDNFTIAKTAFTGVRTLSDKLPKASWVWLGRDADVRSLLAHLVVQLQNQGVPHAYATSKFGYHRIPGDERTFYVAQDCVIANDGSKWTNPTEAPIVYVDPNREVPAIAIDKPRLAQEDTKNVAHNLSRMNNPAVVWPVLGWFAATPLKAIFEELGYRFPILNVSGTRGSGKSTIIQKVFQRLLGYAEPRAYDSNTTRFVTLTLLGSSLSVPVAFTEFRAASAGGFNRYVLMAYDTGRDPRGHADQTTTDYPLTAPFCIDGEDMLDDPAALERIIAVQPDVSAIKEGSECWTAFQELMFFDLSRLALPYYFFLLKVKLNDYVNEAEQMIFDVYNEVLPARVRSNLIVAWTGVLLYRDFMKSLGVDNFYPEKGAEAFRTSLELVYSPRLGRAPTAADEFVEVVVNAAVRGVSFLVWELVDGILWMQLSPAYEYWVGQRVKQHRTTLSKRSVRTQLAELTGEYVRSPGVRTIKGKKVFAFGFDLKAAYDAGLDVPESFGTNTFEVNF
jgi:hypothetical protein